MVVPTLCNFRREGHSSSPTTLPVRTHLAAPIRRIVIGARKELASARRLYDVEGAIGPELRTLSVECDKEMQPLARIGVGDREEGRISDVEISLVERHLCEIVRIFL